MSLSSFVFHIILEKELRKKDKGKTLKSIQKTIVQKVAIRKVIHLRKYTHSDC